MATIVLALGSGFRVGATDPIASEYLRAWHARLSEAGVPAPAERFWRDVATRGTPIVERIAGDDRFVNVTFLYRDDAARSVAVITLENHQLANDRYFALARLTRLPSTDIWYRTYRVRADGRFTYRIAVDDERLFADLTGPEWSARLKALIRDPLNLHPESTRDGPVSLVELPDAPPLRWFARVPGAPEGRVEHVRVGDVARGLDHTLSIYLPPGYSPESGARNLLLVLDGEGVPASMPFPVILDNLQAAGRIDATLAVFVDNRPGKRVADLSYSEHLTAFVRDTLLPWVAAHYRVPADPRHVVIAGRSASGNAALHLAFELPASIGGVVSQSGGYALGEPRAVGAAGSAPAGGLMPDDFPETEWLTRRIATSPARALKVHLEVGTLEDVPWEFAAPQYATPTVLLANRHLRDVLEAKGYALTYREYHGPHDPLVWRGTVGDALAALLPATASR